MYSWPDILSGLVRREGLEVDAAQWALDEIFAGRASEVQVAALLTALRAKGETEDEIRGLVQSMLDNSTPVQLPSDAVDIVGTGGDRANTVNISTMAAIVASSAGARVIKHGSRAASSMSGTADTLEALGVNITPDPELQPRILDEANIAFLFAAMYHPALKNVGGVRKQLAIQTTFNFLGPLANPAQPVAMALGVADDEMAPLMARVIASRGGRGLVFRGFDGLDELTTTSPSDVWLVSGERVHRTSLDPMGLGLAPAAPVDLVGGPPEHNAQVVWDLVDGKPGAVRDIVLLNAAAALLAYHGVDVDGDVGEQVGRYLNVAAEAIDSGKSKTNLQRWIEITNQ